MGMSMWLVLHQSDFSREWLFFPIPNPYSALQITGKNSAVEDLGEQNDTSFDV